jgi:plasmid segregation protein ParM
MIISVDHGNKSIKVSSAHSDGRIFTSGLRESDTKPPFGEDILKYKDKYYTISDKRIPYQREKFKDNRFYILTLFAIAFEIEDGGRYESGMIPIQLLCGLPPAHYGAQYERFEEYFKRGGVEEFEFRGKQFKIYVSEVMSFPQAFAAAMPVYGHISSLPKVMVIDIGGFTADYLLIKNGQADLSVCDSLENGVIILYNQITARVNSDLDLLLDESDIDAILNEKPNNFSDDVKRIINNAAQVFISDLFGKLRERGIDLRSGRVVFVGGGSILLRRQIEASGKVVAPIFVDKITANAKGYELLYRASKTKG